MENLSCLYYYYLISFTLFWGNHMRKTVKALLHADISAFRISKEAGVPYMMVNDLVNGKSIIDNAKFSTIEKLYKYAIELHKITPID